ncbi:MAG: hypothetical protein AABX04_01550 [Nanoarchaeota archaeon]
MKGDEAGAGESIVNTTNATNDALNYFLTGLYRIRCSGFRWCLNLRMDVCYW